jgi:hypothetical protein
MPLRHAWSGLMLVTCLGCAARATEMATINPLPIGSYPFRAELPGGVKFHGMMIVTEDTIVPRPQDGECRPAAGAPSRQHLVYQCAIAGASNVMVSLDRISPLRRSTWGVEAAVRKSRSVCTNWRTWENGTRTCTQSSPEDYFERTNVQGLLIIGPP